jgi:hypothetical protein
MLSSWPQQCEALWFRAHVLVLVLVLATTMRSAVVYGPSPRPRPRRRFKRQSIRLKPIPVRAIQELWNNLEVFINSYNIVDLNLTKVRIGNGECCRRLSEYLPRCSSLAHLDLSTTESVMGDRKSLHHSSNIVQFDFSHCLCMHK